MASTVMISDDTVREVLGAALWRRISNIIEKIPSDSAWECGERLLENADVEPHASRFDDAFDEAQHLRMAIRELHEMALGDHVELPLERPVLAEGLRGIMQGISEDTTFWEQRDLRKRTLLVYDTAEVLFHELAETVEAVA